jgi:hypothetical protein
MSHRYVRRIYHVLALALLALAGGMPGHAEDSAEEPNEEGPPVVIQPQQGEEVQSERRPDGSTMYRVVRRDGSAYCVRIVEPKPFDELDYPRQYRIPCH